MWSAATVASRAGARHDTIRDGFRNIARMWERGWMLKLRSLPSHCCCAGRLPALAADGRLLRRGGGVPASSAVPARHPAFKVTARGCTLRTCLLFCQLPNDLACRLCLPFDKVSLPGLHAMCHVLRMFESLHLQSSCVTGKRRQGRPSSQHKHAVLFCCAGNRHSSTQSRIQFFADSG